MASKRAYYQTAHAAFTEALVASLEPYDKTREVHCPKTRGLYVKIQPTGRRSYYVLYRVNGQRVRTKLGEVGAVKLADVVARAKKYIGQAADGVNQNQQRREAKAKAAKAKATEQAVCMTLRTFLKEKYGPWVKVSNRTGAATLRRLEIAFAPLLDNPLSKLTPDALDEWRTARLAAGVTKATVNRDMTCLKSALKQAVEWGVLAEHPLLGKVTPYRLPRNQKPKSLSLAEEQRLFAALPDAPLYLQTMVRLALHTGMRRGELFHLQWTDVDLKARQLTIRAESTKSEAERKVPLNDALVAALKAWRDNGDVTKITGLVFPGKRGRMNNIKRSWATLRKKAKIEHFTFHGLRHTFCQRLLDKGVDILTVSALMGHVDIATTQIYLSTDSEKKAAAVALLCP